MCDRQCQKKRFKYSDVASAMVSDNFELSQSEAKRKEGAGGEQQVWEASVASWRRVWVHAVLSKRSGRIAGHEDPREKLVKRCGGGNKFGKRVL